VTQHYQNPQETPSADENPAEAKISSSQRKAPHEFCAALPKQQAKLQQREPDYMLSTKS
jgi:hypothetical protein